MMNANPILGSRGEYLAPAQSSHDERPAGPWEANRAALRGRDVREALAGEISERRRREADAAFARLHPPAPTTEERRASIMRRLFNEDPVSADDLNWLRNLDVIPATPEILAELASGRRV